MDILFDKCNLGVIEKVEKLESSQNNVYKVVSSKGKYVVKEYVFEHENILDELFIKTKQINVSKFLNENNIKSIVPLMFNDNYFLRHEDKYYLIYDYFEGEIKNNKDISLEDIMIMSENLAMIHNLNINVDLPSHYKYINIDFDYYLNKFKNKESLKVLYNCLLENKTNLMELIQGCNNDLKSVSECLCLSHNDYKLKNMLWSNNEMYLIDFDACLFSNPIVSLAECAFSLSIQNNEINYQFYKIFLNKYLNVYKGDFNDFALALNCAMNGKLQWLEYLLSLCNEQNLIRINDSINMIKELKLFINNKNKFIEIYNKIKKFT